MWRHNDAQYGQIFVVFAAQSIGVFLFLTGQDLEVIGWSYKALISGFVLLINVIFFLIFVRLRILLNYFKSRISAFENENDMENYPEFHDSLWPTSYMMIAVIALITILELFVIWIGI